MSVTGRDRKILAVIVVLALAAAYWFLLLAPKREEAASAARKADEQRARYETARATLAELEDARTDYATDYATVVRLGKAIPVSVDAPSLIVQLQRAARDTDIEFNKIAAGQRVGAPAAAPAGGSLQSRAATIPRQGGKDQPSKGGSGTPAVPAPPSTAAGGTASAGGATPGATAPGTAPQPGTTAPGGGSAAQTHDPAAETQSARENTPAVRAGKDAPQGPTGPEAAGLERVPLDFSFRGSFFDLADFFHRMKRFVHATSDGVAVRGRLMTVDEVAFKSPLESFPNVTADVKATVYVAPRYEGATGGATPQGPAPAAPAAAGSATQTQPAPPPAPAATVTR